MLLVERPGDLLQQPLDHPNPPRRAGHVVQQQQPPARPQHPPHLGDGAPLIGDGTQREGTDHRVEAGIGQLQRLGVAQVHVDLAAEPVGLAAGQLEHGGAEVDAGQADALRVVGEVAAGADGHLQDLAGGLGADPLAAVAKQPPFPDDLEQAVEEGKQNDQANA